MLSGIQTILKMWLVMACWICLKPQINQLHTRQLKRPYALSRMMNVSIVNHRYRVVAAIHLFFKGSTRGYDLATEFSEAWTDGVHNPDELDSCWSEFSLEDKPGLSHVGTLFYYAMRDGWDSSSLSFGSDLGPHGDAWNGAKFAEERINNLLYVEATGQWLQWSGIRWKSIKQVRGCGFCAQLCSTPLS